MLTAVIIAILALFIGVVRKCISVKVEEVVRHDIGGV